MNTFVLLLVVGIFSFIQAKLPFQIPQVSEFVVIVPTYNNESFVEKNLDSILAQHEQYPHFEIICVNDCSTDKTGECLDTYVKNHRLGHKIKIIHNPENRGAMQNWYDIIHSLSPHKIVVCVDGDDALIGADVLKRLATIYQRGKIWMTYGNYVGVPYVVGSICREFPKEVIKRNNFRKYPFISSHLRTFYAGIFQRIKKEDFMHEGVFLPVNCDVAMMMPLLELCSKGHIRYIPDILYSYTTTNPLSDFRSQKKLYQKVKTYNYIINLKRYNPI